MNEDKLLVYTVIIVFFMIWALHGAAFQPRGVVEALMAVSCIVWISLKLIKSFTESKT